MTPNTEWLVAPVYRCAAVTRSTDCKTERARRSCRSRSWPAHEGGVSARRTCDRQPRPVPCHQRSGRLPRHGKDRRGHMQLGQQARSNVVIAATTTPIGISMRQRLPARTLARRPGGPGRRGICPGRRRCLSEHPGPRSPDRTGEGAADRGAFFLPAYGWDRDRWPALWGPPDGAEAVRPHLHAGCDAGLDLDLDGFLSGRTSPAGPCGCLFRLLAWRPEGVVRSGRPGTDVRLAGSRGLLDPSRCGRPAGRRR